MTKFVCIFVACVLSRVLGDTGSSIRVISHTGQCNLTLFESTVTLGSPDYPKSTKPPAGCHVVLEAPINQVLTLDLADVALSDEDDTCKTSKLEVRDGKSTGAPLIGTYCGIGSDPQFVTTKSRYLQLRFNLDKDLEEGYFFVRVDPLDDVYGVPVLSKPLDSDDDEGSGGKVVGGKEAKKGSHPWQVLFRFPGDHGHCGGALLNNHWVLTAAHCFDLLPPGSKTSQLQVILGTHNQLISEPQQLVAGIKEVVLHPKYNRVSQDADLALVELDSNIQFNDYIRPAALGDPDFVEKEFFSKPNVQGVVSGWGKTENSDFSKVLQEIRVPIKLSVVCKASTELAITENMFCAGYSKGQTHRDTCKGDSGSPFVADHDGKYYVIGVVSFGEQSCLSKGKYGFYAMVHKFMPWIKEVAGL